MEYSKKKRVYVFCVAVFLLGVILFFGNVVKSFTELGSTLTEFVFPGEHAVRLSEKGLYSVYRQYEGADFDVPPEEDSITISVTRISDKKPVELKTPDSRKKYRYMGKKGVKILEFENPAPGDYVVGSFSRDATEGLSYTLALERGFEMRRLKGILLSQAFLLVPTLFAIILFIRTYVRS